MICTLHTYIHRELEGAVSVDSDSKDPLLTDVNNKFINCMEQFQKSTKVSIIYCICLLDVHIVCMMVVWCSCNDMYACLY